MNVAKPPRVLNENTKDGCKKQRKINQEIPTHDRFAYPIKYLNDSYRVIHAPVSNIKLREKYDKFFKHRLINILPLGNQGINSLLAEC